MPNLKLGELLASKDIYSQQPVIYGVRTLSLSSAVKSNRSSCIYLPGCLPSGTLQIFGTQNIICQGVAFTNYVLCKVPPPVFFFLILSLQPADFI